MTEDYYTPKEEAEMFRVIDKEIGPQLETIFEGDEDKVVKWSPKKWRLMVRYVSGPLMKRILFDESKRGTDEYGEKHPAYKWFEMFLRGTKEVVSGEPPPVYNPATIGAAFYILFARSGDALEKARRFFEVEIVKTPEAETESQLREAGALDGVP